MYHSILESRRYLADYVWFRVDKVTTRRNNLFIRNSLILLQWDKRRIRMQMRWTLERETTIHYFQVQKTPISERNAKSNETTQ